MDMIYMEKPALLLFPLVLLAWQFTAHFLQKKLSEKKCPELLFTGISTVGHAAAIVVILLSGGTLYDVLVLVLLTGFVSLLLCPKPVMQTEEKDK